MRKDDLDEDRSLGPAGFVFQTTVRAKKGSPAKGILRATRIATAMGQIGRVVHRRPEVMVKVTGSARGLRSLKEHLAYITRNGKLLGERESGELSVSRCSQRCLVHSPSLAWIRTNALSD